MKRLILSLFVAVSFAGTAFAADVVKYEAKTGTVTFNHKSHGDTLKDCAKCHQGTPAKIEMNKDVAHKMCKGCHAETGGPTKCGDCHKK